MFIDKNNFIAGFKFKVQQNIFMQSESDMKIQ